jgi:hypothetical protein
VVLVFDTMLVNPFGGKGRRAGGRVVVESHLPPTSLTWFQLFRHRHRMVFAAALAGVPLALWAAWIYLGS